MTERGRNHDTFPLIYFSIYKNTGNLWGRPALFLVQKEISCAAAISAAGMNH
jgi:hypothetical protein